MWGASRRLPASNGIGWSGHSPHLATHDLGKLRAAPWLGVQCVVAEGVPFAFETVVWLAREERLTESAELSGR
jgi:hypothetical protein